MLANDHNQIATSEVLLPPKCFWYYLLDLPFGIQSIAGSFQMELDHLISWDAPRGAILSGAACADITSLDTFHEILSGNGLEYDSDDIDYYCPSHECFHIDYDNPINDALSSRRRTRVPAAMWSTFERRLLICRLGRWT
jgi:hypothetical protein